MPNNQFPNNTLGQSSVNKKSRSVMNAPDTDSRLVKVLNGAVDVQPNLMHDHTRFEYIVPSGNGSPVKFNDPINTEDRSLHWLVLDNSNNSGLDKVFNFSNSYIFLDDLSNISKSYTVGSNKKMVWFGTYMAGKLNLRVATESTN